MAFKTVSVGYFEGPAPKTVIHLITAEELDENDQGEIIERGHEYRPIPDCCLVIDIEEDKPIEIRKYSTLGKNELALLFKEEDRQMQKKYSEINREDVEKVFRYFE